MSTIYDSTYKNTNEIGKCEQNMRYEMTPIIQDILTDIINIAVEKCEHITMKQLFDMQQNVLDDISSLDVYPVNTEQTCDLLKNYNPEIETMLQNLECMSIKSSEKSTLCSLEQQIKSIIEEIKDLDQCVREDTEKCTTDNTIQEETRLDGYSSTIGIEPRPALTDLTLPEESNLLQKSDITDEISDEEIELQVIDLNSASTIFQESFNQTTIDAGQKVKEINLTKQNIEPISLEQGDHCEQNLDDNTEQTFGLEKHDVDASQLEENNCDHLEEQYVADQEPKKKMNLGSRLWVFFTRKQHSANSSVKKQ